LRNSMSVNALSLTRSSFNPLARRAGCATRTAAMSTSGTRVSILLRGARVAQPGNHGSYRAFYLSVSILLRGARVAQQKSEVPYERYEWFQSSCEARGLRNSITLATLFPELKCFNPLARRAGCATLLHSGLPTRKADLFQSSCEARGLRNPKKNKTIGETSMKFQSSCEARGLRNAGKGNSHKRDEVVSILLRGARVAQRNRGTLGRRPIVRFNPLARRAGCATVLSGEL